MTKEAKMLQKLKLKWGHPSKRTEKQTAKIKELELENKKLKMGAPYGGASQAEDKNWLNSGFGGNTS